MDKYYEQAVACVKDYVLPAQCECSRQNILYTLSQLKPNSSFEVEILETAWNFREEAKQLKR